MSSYVYDPLSPGSIRLLRLSPSQDEQAPIHCHLFPYPLSSSRTGTHLYEALSYYWGSPEKIHTITVGDGSLQITRNLHTALQSLRDRLIERIIWIDAVCINQDDAEEKGLQVQLMAEIYAKASRVIVWLENTTGDPDIDDEAYNDSAQALEIIDSFATGQQFGNTNEWLQNGSADEWSLYRSSEKEVRDQAVAKLLGRAWFRRIWVLQEVAAARHILIKCHLAEIDGYAFCLGLEKMRIIFMDKETLVRIRSTLYLIRAAALRPKRVDSTSARFSLQVWPLMNLIELYSAHEATDRRDKVYALLGMSIDMPTGIVPDYRIAWADLFRQVVKSTLTDCMSVDTWNKHDIAVIKIKGCVVGRVRSTHVDNDWIGQQEVVVNFRLSRSEARWVLHATAQPIKENDVVCFLQGASLPTIVRVYNDYCDIIAIAVTPIFRETQEDIMGPLRTTVYQQADVPTEFLLVWNWDASSGRAYEKSSFESCMIKNGLHCSAPCKSDRLMNVGSLYRALGSEKEAILPFRSIVKLYEDSSQRDHPISLAAVDALLETCKADRSLAAEDKVEGLEMMANVLHRSEGFVVINEDLISRIASNPYAEVMKFVLHTYAEQITVTESILVAAAANKRDGRYIMELLLNFHGYEVTISENILAAAAANWHLGKAIIDLCLRRMEDQIVITERVVKAAARMDLKLFLLGLKNCSFPFNERTYYLFIPDRNTYPYNWDIHPEDILRLVASFLERQTEDIIITGRLVRSLLNIKSKHSAWTWAWTWAWPTAKLRLIEQLANRKLEGDVLAMMLGWEGGRVVVTHRAVEEMADIGPNYEESLRKLGNKLLRELT